MRPHAEFEEPGETSTYKRELLLTTLNRVLLRMVMFGVLVVSMLSERKKGCSISKILQHYRVVVYDELQYLKNLTGAVKSKGRVRGNAGPPCWAQKELRILTSLYSLSLSLACEVNRTAPHRLERAVYQVALNIGTLLTSNCQMMEQQHRKEKNSGCKTLKVKSKASSEVPTPLRRNRKRQRRRIAQAIENITGCWERLYHLHCTGCARHST
ncbi:uncharacterized protein C20orf204 homolog [Ambystoma mexicanum]|uniref:uncharacterized protein C20orf204 homolog n=1 Tax=Ambystoma mexicanum TaxID=8296 RepID=UPI0037E7CB4C